MFDLAVREPVPRNHHIHPPLHLFPPNLDFPTSILDQPIYVDAWTLDMTMVHHIVVVEADKFIGEGQAQPMAEVGRRRNLSQGRGAEVHPVWRGTHQQVPKISRGSFRRGARQERAG